MKLYIILFFLNISFLLFSDKLTIGIAEPFIYNQTSGTVFVKNNFIFELFTSLRHDKYNLFSIDISTEDISKYKSSNIRYSQGSNIEYLILTEVMSIKDNIYITISFVNTYLNEEILKKNYRMLFDIRINEKLENLSREIINNILDLELTEKTTVINPFEIFQEEAVYENDIISELLLTFNNYPKHEIFVMNSFFKTNSNIFSYLSIYTGYNNYVSNNFFVDIGIFGGFGRITNLFPYNEFHYRDQFAGIFGGLHFFIKGIIEPNFGARVEFTYTSRKDFFLSIPVDMGFKIFTNKNNVIRLTASFPLNTFDIINTKWQKKMTLGIMIGYGFKI